MALILLCILSGKFSTEKLTTVERLSSFYQHVSVEKRKPEKLELLETA